MSTVDPVLASALARAGRDELESRLALARRHRAEADVKHGRWSREHELARLRLRQIAAEFAERGLPLPARSGYADTHTTRVQ